MIYPIPDPSADPINSSLQNWVHSKQHAIRNSLPDQDCGRLHGFMIHRDVRRGAAYHWSPVDIEHILVFYCISCGGVIMSLRPDPTKTSTHFYQVLSDLATA